MRHVSSAAYGLSAGYYKRLTSAVSDQSIKIPNAKQLKTRLSSLVAQWSTKAGHRITAPEIRELYDIIASMRDGKAIDTDFKGNPETFAKAIRRQPTWPLTGPDKN